MNQQEIEAGIQALSLSSGDIVLLHSSLSSLGQVMCIPAWFEANPLLHRNVEPRPR